MKKWLLERFLPMWAKENRALQEKIRQLESYIEGLQTGLRAGRKIQILAGGGK